MPGVFPQPGAFYASAGQIGSRTDAAVRSKPGSYDPERPPRAKCCGCTEAFQASRAGSIPVARLRTGHGEWRSLVAHPAGGRAVAGSNPVSPIREDLEGAGAATG